jgi:hypothetical protein
METIKSSDEIEFIVALLCDIQNAHEEVFTTRALRLTLQKVRNRYAREGSSFLTKTLPRLGKALDRALTGEVPLNSVGWRKLPNSQLPIFMGELFQRIFSHDGWILPTSSVKCIADMRQLCALFGKYELPYSEKQEQRVLQAFEGTENELKQYTGACTKDSTCLHSDIGCGNAFCWKTSGRTAAQYCRIIHKAKAALEELFLDFDEKAIVPRHGPGAVSTKEKASSKYRWSVIPDRIRETYPLDAYFFASLNAVCDKYNRLEFERIDGSEVPAKIVLVPKDSRGPRVISEECLANQWTQQGLRIALYKHVERHPLTRHSVHFTDQRPNQLGALLGSQEIVQSERFDCQMGKPTKRLMIGKYATLDLKEASDRISLPLVRLLFPRKILTALENCRSLSTTLPGNKTITLIKYAPMGSALCFPVLALSIWALLYAGSTDADARESILVYGDDVVVKTAEAENAITLLESFGLKINRDKSCVRGFFRESCGVDAYKGHNITPVRFRTVWRTSLSPDVLTSYCEYANSTRRRGYITLSNLIGRRLVDLFGYIPLTEYRLGVPSLDVLPLDVPSPALKYHHDHQCLKVKVWAEKLRRVDEEICGWSMLLRYFTENDKPSRVPRDPSAEAPISMSEALNNLCEPCFRVRSYTLRGTEKLVRQYVSAPGNFKIASVNVLSSRSERHTRRRR